MAEQKDEQGTKRKLTYEDSPFNPPAKRTKTEENLFPSSFWSSQHSPGKPQVKSIEKNERVDNFFKELVEKYSKKLEKQIAFIVVAHALPTLPALFKALDNISNGIAGYILKGSKQDKKMVEYAEKHYPNKRIHKTKEDLKDNHDFIIEFVRSSDPQESYILIDIGGYFAPLLATINQVLSDRILGIVEDTENGHQKYHTEINKIGEDKLLIPVFSVARSELKKAEDYNVGKSIVQAADSVIRKNLHQRLEDHKAIGVIGFGKIGRSIATHLRQKNIGNVLVYDHNPNVLIVAASQDFTVADKKKILDQSSMVFCATGNKSLSVDDFRHFKQKNVLIVSCTSKDDEFDLTGLPLPNEIYKDESNAKYAKYLIYDKEIVLLGDGNAINFFYKAIVGEYIRGVQGALIACALKISHNDFDLKKYAEKIDGRSELLILSPKEEEFIAKLWLKCIEDIEFGVKHNLILQKNMDFVDRKKEVAELYAKLNGTTYTMFKKSISIIKVYGNRGVGKTELVKSFIAQNKEQYDLVWWFDMKNNRELGYLELAKELNIVSEAKPIQDVIDEIHKKISVQTNFLLVFDNVKDIKIMESDINFMHQLTGGKRHIIIIYDYTVKPIPENSDVKIEVKSFEKNDAFDYVNKFLENENKDAINSLFEITAFHPLALEKAAAYIKQTKTLISTYVNIIKEKHNKQNEISGNDSLKFVIIESLQSLKKSDESAYKILFLISLIDGIEIQQKIFEETKEICRYNEHEVLSKIEILKGYKFVAEMGSEKRGKIYTIHDWVQEIVVDYFSIHEKDLFAFLMCKAIELLLKLFNYDYFLAAQKTVSNLKPYIKHVIALLNRLDSLKVSIEQEGMKKASDLSDSLGSYYLNESRDYIKSLEYYTLATKLFPNNLNASLGQIVDKTFLIRDGSLNLTDLSSVINDAEKLELSFDKESIPKERKDICIAHVKIASAFLYKYKAKYNASKEEQLKYLAKAGSYVDTSLTILNALSFDKQFEDVVKRIRGLAHHAKGGISFSIYALKPEKIYLADSLHNYSQAIDLREKLDPNHLDLARTYQKRSQVLLEEVGISTSTAALANAEEQAQKALTIQINQCAPDRNLLETYKTLVNIAEKSNKAELKKKYEYKIKSLSRKLDKPSITSAVSSTTNQQTFTPPTTENHGMEIEIPSTPQLGMKSNQ